VSGISGDVNCILYEDPHLLVARKPAGWNTHSPSPFAGEGLYEWLRHREPRWAGLALIHRLDKETSGLIVFAKSLEARRSLTRQFETGQVTKLYRFLTDRPVPFRERTVRTAIVRCGNRYLARPSHAGSRTAVTHLRRVVHRGAQWEWEASPVTGLTHQIRVHAAAAGIPILGDRLYSDDPDPAKEAIGQPTSEQRLCLHAHTLRFLHPASGEPRSFEWSIDWTETGPWELREAFIDAELTRAYRLVNGGPDGMAATTIDRFGDFLLQQRTAGPDWSGPSPHPTDALRRLAARLGCRGVYDQKLQRGQRAGSPTTHAPHLIWGDSAPDSWPVVENGIRYEIRFDAGPSVGLFLDQRDNRRRLLMNHVGAGFAVRERDLEGASVLNTFAYSCGFSVCAALAGAHTTSIDLSRKNLEWGRRNFALNGLKADSQEFLAGDVLDWLGRFTRRQRRFAMIILDPPTFSRTREGRVFRAERDYLDLARMASAALEPGGVLLACTNAVSIRPAEFVEQLHRAVVRSGRRVTQEHYAPAPPDFPSTRGEPPHFKSVWLRVDGPAEKT